MRPAARARPQTGAAAGTHKLEWDGRDASWANLPSGLYFLRAGSTGEASPDLWLIHGRITRGSLRQAARGQGVGRKVS
jgi:hypothetical protein